ncbi:MAG: hypothetical protein ABJE66_36285 [Deltaproteobacteria bacterium]
MLLYLRTMRLSILCFLVACATNHSTPTLVPDDATRVIVHREGGFAPHPEGSTCTAIDETFTVDLASGAVTYHVCSTAAGNSPYAFADGQLAPSADQLAIIRDSIAALPTVIPACSGDLNDSITVVTPTGSTTYDHVQCLDSEGSLVEALDSLFAQLGSA